MIYTAKELLPLVRRHGRTLFEEGRNALFFDWTNSGLSLRFTGTRLSARVLAWGDRLPFPPDAETDYPCLGLTEDGESLRARFRCEEGEAEYPLYEGAAGEHRVRLIKLSENMRGKTALLSLETDGELLPFDGAAPRLTMEFIGDSITCGFGNEAPGRDSLFDTREENGWMTYGAVAGRELGAEFNMVSVSGISVSRAERGGFPGRAMREVYPYADVYLEERLGREPRPWDFAGARKDVVVLNLGTNDVNPMRFARTLEDADREERWFRARYREFLGTLREKNGPETLLVCVLGPLDHYLWDDIAEAVAAYKAETGDKRIEAFKLLPVNLMTEGFGAVSHPSLKTQVRMGHELAQRLKAIFPRYGIEA